MGIVTTTNREAIFIKVTVPKFNPMILNLKITFLTTITIIKQINTKEDRIVRGDKC